MLSFDATMTARSNGCADLHRILGCGSIGRFLGGVKSGISSARWGCIAILLVRLKNDLMRKLAKPSRVIFLYYECILAIAAKGEDS